jgi:uroporphyrinogen-III decarboxylase
MTPRERFCRVTSHPPKWPDKICNEFVGFRTACILDEEPYGLKAVADYIGVPDYADPAPDPVFGYTEVDDRILEKFNTDFRYVPNRLLSSLPHETSLRGQIETLPNGYFRGFYGTLWKPAYGTSRSYGTRPGVPRLHLAPDAEQPGAQLKTLQDIEDYPYWPDTESTKARQIMESNARQAAKLAKRLHETTDYAIVGGAAAYSSERHHFVRGFTQWFKDLKKNPEFYHAFAAKMLQIGMDTNEIMLNAIGDYIDRVHAGPGDMGFQQGPMISLEHFREFCVPYQEKAIAQIKKFTKARIYAHMCGSIHLYLGDLAAMGIDMVGQQINPNTYHMEPERLHRDFGDIITFWGGLDTQIVLVSYNKEMIRDWVQRVIYALAPGHVVASNHSIGPDAAPENIWFAHECIEEFSKLVYG